MGFDFIMAGEEGLVDLSDFTLAGKRHRGERALVNKFERENGTFEIIQPPFDQPTLDSLHKISDEWLGDQVEKGFSLGYFDAYYLNQAPIAWHGTQMVTLWRSPISCQLAITIPRQLT